MSTAATSTLGNINSGDTAWILVSTALVMLMIPGLGYFYSGLARHKNALSLIFLSTICLASVSIQWFLFGYSLAFSSNSGPFIGNFEIAFFTGLFNAPNVTYLETSTIPQALFMIYQGMFASITPALVLGASAERTRIVPAIVFIFLWTTFVYDFIAYWHWAKNGWANVLGVLDFAGGTPVHISSGAAGLAFSIVVGKRKDIGSTAFKPHNLSSVFLGTALLWFGWFGFNAGSELSANNRSVLALVNTNLAACSAALTWVILESVRTKKYSAFALCSGAVAGLVAVTPAAGFVQPWAAFLIGIAGASACFTFIAFKHHLHVDDALDAFGIHGIGGITGCILTGIFADKQVVAMDGTNIAGGWVNGHFAQLGIQLAGCVAGFMWSFVGTILMLLLLDRLPHLNLRITVEEEALGVDKSQLGEVAYDYIEAGTLERAATGHSVEDVFASEKALNKQAIEMTVQ